MWCARQFKGHPMAGIVKVTQLQRAQWPSDHKLGNWIRQKILTTCHMSTNIIISTMTSRRMRRGKKDVESRVRAFTSCHWHPPLNQSCHVLLHPHNPSAPICYCPLFVFDVKDFPNLISFCCCCSRRRRSMSWCWLPHGDIWNLSAFKQATRQGKRWGAGRGG